MNWAARWIHELQLGVHFPQFVGEAQRRERVKTSVKFVLFGEMATEVCTDRQ